MTPNTQASHRGSPAVSPTGERGFAPDANDYSPGEGCLQQAERRMTAGDLVGALANAGEAIRLRPDDAEAYLLRAKIRRAMEDLCGAVEDLDRAIELRPNFADAYLHRSAARCDLDDAQGADADSAQALRLKPGDADFHAMRGAALHGLKDYRSAIAQYDEALKINGDFCWVYVLRAQAYHHTMNADRTYADYARAFALQPEMCARLMVRSLMRTIAQDPRAALAECDEHLRTTPDDPMSYARRGLTLMLLDRDAEAQPDLDQFRTRRPEDSGRLQQVIDLVLCRRHRAPTASHLTADEAQVATPLCTVNPSLQPSEAPTSRMGNRAESTDWVMSAWESDDPLLIETQSVSA